MKMTPDQMHELVDATQGTCQSLEEICEKHFGFEPSEYDNEREILEFVDNHIFCCEGCCWWCEMSEMTNDPDHDWTCTDCNPNLGDD